MLSGFETQGLVGALAFCLPTNAIRIPHALVDNRARCKPFRTKPVFQFRYIIPTLSVNAIASGRNEQQNEDIVSTRTKSWVKDIVVGLGLCPFAEPAMQSDGVRYVISRAAHESMVRKVFSDEVKLLMAAEPEQISTTLIVMPEFAESDFLRFHVLTNSIEEQISEDEDLADSVLIAAFHPDFRYDDTTENDALNFEKRAPYPIINILRAELLDEYISQGKTHNIPRHNRQVLERLGSEQLKRLYCWD